MGHLLQVQGLHAAIRELILGMDPWKSRFCTGGESCRSVSSTSELCASVNSVHLQVVLACVCFFISFLFLHHPTKIIILFSSCGIWIFGLATTLRSLVVVVVLDHRVKLESSRRLVPKSHQVSHQHIHSRVVIIYYKMFGY